MDKNRRFLIFLDGIINLLIGLALLLFPWGMGNWLGLPIPNNFFYPTLLGAVIFGIGVALMLEWRGPRDKYQGLGLEGAITINFAGGGVLLMWLLLSPPQLPLRGMILLWVVALAVLIVGLIEFTSRFLHRS
jgi:hypothetical protein